MGGRQDKGRRSHSERSGIAQKLLYPASCNEQWLVEDRGGECVIPSFHPFIVNCAGCVPIGTVELVTRRMRDTERSQILKINLPPLVNCCVLLAREACSSRHGIFRGIF
jgi:hypothetical protein